MNHTMVVTSKTPAMIYLTYHTTDTLHKPFSAMAGMNVA